MNKVVATPRADITMNALGKIPFKPFREKVAFVSGVELKLHTSVPFEEFRARAEARGYQCLTLGEAMQYLHLLVIGSIPWQRQYGWTRIATDKPVPSTSEFSPSFFAIEWGQDCAVIHCDDRSNYSENTPGVLRYGAPHAFMFKSTQVGQAL